MYSRSWLIFRSHLLVVIVVDVHPSLDRESSVPHPMIVVASSCSTNMLSEEILALPGVSRSGAATIAPVPSIFRFASYFSYITCQCSWLPLSPPDISPDKSRRWIQDQKPPSWRRPRRMDPEEAPSDSIGNNWYIYLQSLSTCDMSTWSLP